jgi:prevent-host-death family protein
MEAIPQRELRNQSSEILRRVQAGEAFTITNHGKAVAVLRPFDERIGGLEPRIRHTAFNVEDFLVQSINADLLGAVLANRESKR